MTYASISASVTKIFSKTIESSLLAALLLVTMCASVKPAQAQSSDTWKSVAIIGGSTAVGAYIGHKVAGSTGAYVGAAAGAATGYAIDRRRRQNEYNSYNNDYPYGNNGGYYGNNNNDPNYGNGGYSDSRNSYPNGTEDQNRPLPRRR